MTNSLRSWIESNKYKTVGIIWLVLLTALASVVVYPPLILLYMGLFFITVLTVLIYIFVDIFLGG